MRHIFDFLYKNFTKMHPVVQNIVYLVFVCVVVANFFVKNFYDGKIVIKDELLESPIQNAIVTVEEDGRYIQMITGKHGNFYIPTASKFRYDRLKLYLYPNGQSEKRYPIELSIRDNVFKEFSIQQNEEGNFNVISSNLGKKLIDTFVERAYAFRSQKKITIEEVSIEVMKAAKRSLKFDVTAKFNQENPGSTVLTNVQKSYVTAYMHKLFGIEIGREAYKKVKTIDDFSFEARASFYKSRNISKESAFKHEEYISKYSNFLKSANPELKNEFKRHALDKKLPFPEKVKVLDELLKEIR